MPFDGKLKSVRSFVPPFLKRALRLEPIERAVHLDGGEAFRAKPEPLFLRHVAVESIAPAFVIPSAGADVCFAGHSGNNVGGALAPTGFYSSSSNQGQGSVTSSFRFALL